MEKEVVEVWRKGNITLMKEEPKRASCTLNGIDDTAINRYYNDISMEEIFEQLAQWEIPTPIFETRTREEQEAIRTPDGGISIEPLRARSEPIRNEVAGMEPSIVILDEIAHLERVNMRSHYYHYGGGIGIDLAARDFDRSFICEPFYEEEQAPEGMSPSYFHIMQKQRRNKREAFRRRR